MEKKNLRIVFMGTPEFAVASLDALVQGGYNVVGVVTMPDKPAGRGHKVQFSAVKTYALAHDLPLLQPEKLKNEEFLNELRTLKVDLQIVVAFRMLPEVVWAMPKYGTFNLHGSLLPQYRGAAPINWAVINGEKETGVTTFFLQQEIDTGDLILQRKIPITDADTAGTIHDQLMVVGAQTVIDTVDELLNGTITATPQIYSDTLRPAPKIFKETCRIDWHLTGREIFNFVRGLSPYPAAWTVSQWGDMKIFAVKPCVEAHALACGEMVVTNKSVRIACADGFVEVLELQLPAKKRMNAQAFLNGLH